MYYFFRDYFTDVDLFDMQHYISLMEEGPEYSIFGPPEEISLHRSFIQLINDTEVDNCIDGMEEECSMHVLAS